MVHICTNRLIFISGYYLFIFLISSTGRLKLNLDLHFSYIILKKSFPYALLILLMTIYYRVDVIMLEIIMGPSEAGIYAVHLGFLKHQI